MKKKQLLPVLLLAVVLSSLVMFFVESFSAQYNLHGDDIDRFGGVYRSLFKYYVREIPQEELSQLVVDSINDMLAQLDPYSVLAYRRADDELEIQTTGQYGGLGIMIQERKKWPTVMEVFPETPASDNGLVTGDRIVEIEGVSTYDLTMDEVVGRLRGGPGDPVSIVVERPGVEGKLPFIIKRQEIERRNVGYYSLLDSNIGYVKLGGFTERASNEIEKALSYLMEKQVTGLILDLRNNPGGMLPQSQYVADMFLNKGDIIVTTKGRGRKNKGVYKATKDPVVPDNIPLVVLINRSSASASEIVAGAIQDWDRGLCIGDTTFGKGSVQTLYKIDNVPRSSLKLTTAYYYTPSERLIHRIQRQTPDDETEERVESRKSSKIYYTKKFGRPVNGGGGIAPDILVHVPPVKHFVGLLISQGTLFDFAVRYNNTHDVTQDFTVRDEVMAEFAAFIEDKEHFTYKPAGIELLNEFEEMVKKEKFSQKIKDKLIELKKSLEAGRDEEFLASKEDIRRLIKQEIFAAEGGKEGRVRASLQDDIQLDKAIEVLKDSELYNSYFKPPSRKKMVAD